MKKEILILIFFALILIITYAFIKFSSRPDASNIYNEEDVLTVEEEHWRRVFNKAFESVDCPEPRDINALPDEYYKGPMIDTHIHLQSLPDGEPGHPDDYYVGENLGIRKSMNEWICMLDVEGTKQAWGFFPVWEPIIQESIDVVSITMGEHDGRFIPFIMPPSNKDPTVSAKDLEKMLNIERGLFKGYGEIGLYGNPDSPPLPPDSKKLIEIYPILREHNLVAYFHLGEGQKEALERVAEANPDIIFVFHGDQLIDCGECDGTHKEVAEILETYPNVYYGVDEIYGGEWLLKPGRNKTDFLQNLVDYEPLLKADLKKFKEFIESYPDQVVFGTDRGVSAIWDKDPDVAVALNNYARAFIGKLDPEVQEKFAYKNAEKLFSG